ncbi:MAG: methionyl-tRNA formyltransferase [Longimicrobiaceae bacterium]
MRVLFWGTPGFAVPTLLALAGEGHEVVGVVTRPDRPAGRGRATASSRVKEAAEAEGMPVLQPEALEQGAFLERLLELGPEVSVVVAYGRLLPPEVLELPAHGSLNLHPSLLPELRGAAPVEWAVIRGYRTTGVSVMRMEAELDAGPVLWRVEEPVRPDECAAELRLRLSEIGAEAVVETLAALEAAALSEEPQEDSRATYAPKIERQDARLDWNLPAAGVASWVRGLDDDPGGWSLVDGGDPVKLFRPVVEAARGGSPGEVLEADPRAGLLVAAGDGAAVRIHQVQPAGRRRMEATEWVKGRGITAGQRLS